MYKRLPPLNSLKAFESSARHLSFTKAAEELFVTQAAVSHQIKILESFLGIDLFIRKNRALELTDLGKMYFADISKVLNRLADATSKLLTEKNSRHLTITVPQTFGIQWLVPKLTEFNQLYPDIEVRLKGEDEDEGILNDNVDVSIYYGKGNWDTLQVEKLAEGNLLLLASPKLLEKKPINTVNDLNNHTIIHIKTRDNWQNMVNYLQVDGLNINHGPLFSHTFMALQAAIHGQGIVLANKILAKQEVENGTLKVVLPIKNLLDSKAFYLVNQLDKADNECINIFKKWIIEKMQKG